MKKTVLSLLLAVVILILSCLTSCEEEPNLESIARCKEEFAQYYSGVDRVVGDHTSKLYFQNHTLSKEQLPRYLKFYNGKMYGLRAKQGATEDEMTITIYAYDLFGENEEIVHIENVFEGSGVNYIGTWPWHNCFYISRMNEDKKYVLDRYSLSSGLYETIAVREKSFAIQDVAPDIDKYQVKIETSPDATWWEKAFYVSHRRFVITDRQTGEERIIDDQYLANTVYKASMDKFGGYEAYCGVFNGEHILLQYDIVRDFYGELVFEYNFETDELEFLAILFPPENWNLTYYEYIEYVE